MLNNLLDFVNLGYSILKTVQVVALVYIALNSEQRGSVLCFQGVSNWTDSYIKHVSIMSACMYL